MRTIIKKLTQPFLTYMNRFLSHPPNLFGMLALFISLSISPFANAQTTTAANDTLSRTINLEQAIQISLANNTQMKRSLLSVRDADQQIRNAWSNVMPSIAASANYTRNLEVPVNFIPAIIFDPNATPGKLIPVASRTDNSW